MKLIRTYGGLPRKKRAYIGRIRIPYSLSRIIVWHWKRKWEERRREEYERYIEPYS